MKSVLKKFLDRLGVEVRRTRSGRHHFPGHPYQAQKTIIDGLAVTSPVILDVGAHRGDTIARYRELFPQSRIFGFEPHPGNAAYLRSRFAGDPRVRILDVAIAGENGTVNFYINHNDATSSLLPRSTQGRRYYNRKAELKSTATVSTTTLDSFLADESIEHIDILKFDIQGGELSALQGASRLLASGKVSLIYTETFFAPHYENNPYLHDLWSYLEKYGYSLFDIYDLYRARNGQLRFADVIFVSREVRERVLDAYAEEP